MGRATSAVAMQAVAGLMAGDTAARTIGRYQKRVRANRHRLSKRT
jgi:hypothetical protein